ncbi:MAG: Smr/MutS family protein [Pseudomonadota bacterium]|jgi:DNA-nicking Smr family endonuclease
MGTRHLSSDEAALWARVMAGVRPLAKAAPTAPATGSKTARAAAPVPVAPPVTAAPAKRVVGRIPPPPVPKPARVAAPANRANTLDGTWDKQIARGLVSPDRTIDLHGHTLQSAYNELDGALDAAIRAGDRTILLVTGKPPRPTSERPHARGAIRAATGDWLAGSRHADAIAAVRTAHPRHGGSGALYIVLKRARASRKS